MHRVRTSLLAFIAAALPFVVIYGNLMMLAMQGRVSIYASPVEPHAFYFPTNTLLICVGFTIAALAMIHRLLGRRAGRTGFLVYAMFGVMAGLAVLCFAEIMGFTPRHRSLAFTLHMLVPPIVAGALAGLIYRLVAGLDDGRPATSEAAVRALGADRCHVRVCTSRKAFVVAALVPAVVVAGLSVPGLFASGPASMAAFGGMDTVGGMVIGVLLNAQWILMALIAGGLTAACALLAVHGVARLFRLSSPYAYALLGVLGACAVLGSLGLRSNYLIASLYWPAIVFGMATGYVYRQVAGVEVVRLEVADPVPVRRVETAVPNSSPHPFGRVVRGVPPVE